MANPWDNDLIVSPAGQPARSWESDPIVQPAQRQAPPAGDVQALRAALMAAHDSGNLAEERRISLALKQVDNPGFALGETTLKPVSKHSFY